MIIEILALAVLAAQAQALPAFKRPQFPERSQGVYSFEPIASGHGLQTQTGGFFSLALGFKPAEGPAFPRRHAHRKKALSTISRLERRLEKLQIPRIQISVGRVYASINEVIINVRVEDPSQTQKAKAELIEFLSKTPRIAFVGEPGTVRVE